MDSGWGSGGQMGYVGGFGKVLFADLSQMTKFSFWINPDIAGQDFNLEINICLLYTSPSPRDDR